MSVETIQPYRHSGRFSPAGPIATLGAAAILSIPLGLVYAYLVRWIPFIYLNVLITLGYGIGLGILCAWLLKRFKVRNNVVAIAVAAGAGVAGLYGTWSGSMHALLEDGPLVASPAELWQFIQVLYSVGSWSLRGLENITGVLLGLVWVVEAGMLVGMTVVTTWGKLAHTPFCETRQCWLEEIRTLDTLAPFTDAGQLSQLKSGDINPLLEAKPRESGSWSFARITLRYSPQSDLFCTMLIENVTQERNGKGEVKEKKTALTDHLMLPHAMRELVEKFASFENAAPAEAVAPSS